MILVQDKPARKMRIVHLTFGFPPQIGGVETFVADLTAWQAANGFAVTVIAGSTATDPHEEHRCGVHVHRLPFIHALSHNDLSGVAAIRRKITSISEVFAPEIIHLHPVAAEMLFMGDFIRSTTVPVVTTLHVDVSWQPPVYRKNLGALLARSGIVAVVSDALLRDARRTFPDRASKLCLVENGLASRDPIAVNASPDQYLYLGRLSHEKGVDVALRALALLANGGDRFYLTIAGDGPAREALEALTEALNLRGQVSFLGQVDRDDVPSILSRHTALLVPSRWQEPFGLVVLEAAMAARPAIVSSVGALRDLVEHGITGLHVATEAPEELAAAMIELKSVPERARVMGAAAAARASKDYPISRSGTEYRKLYRLLTRDSVDRASHGMSDVVD